jgi:hypothetical protein
MSQRDAVSPLLDFLRLRGSDPKRRLRGLDSGLSSVKSASQSRTAIPRLMAIR